MIQESNRVLAHCGAQYVTYDDIINTKTPERTKTHIPIPHSQVVDISRQKILDRGYEIRSESHALMSGGMKYFGLMNIKQESDNESCLSIGIRNSHDKTIPLGLVGGDRVFVCDNLSFFGSIEISRKHTRNILRDIDRITTECVDKIFEMRDFHKKRIQRYKEYSLTNIEENDLFIRALDAKVIPSSKLNHVIGEYRNPRVEQFKEQKNIWGIHNAFTSVMKQLNLFSVPMRSALLHRVLDHYCGLSMQN